MKEIQPISIWFNGQALLANRINMYVVHDNLVDSATFYYQLICYQNDSFVANLAEGNLVMNGQAYEDWGNTGGDINNEAYVWAAQSLNLTLITP